MFLKFPELKNDKIVEIGDDFFTEYYLNLYNENILTAPHDWFYRTNKVKCTLNNQGYRCPEFNEINWKDSVVIFGCSNVFGVELDDNDTISTHLSKIINKPVINLGVYGCSIEFCVFNALCLKKICDNPYAIINMWPGFDRFCEFFKNKTEHYGLWNFHDGLNNGYNLETRMIKMIELHRCIWKDQSKYYEGTFFDEVSGKLNIDYFEMIDYARDLKHPGRITTKIVAEQIAKKIF
jgi:hypothetical protein